MAERPSFDQAIVERKKIVDYLLSAKHPVGRTKAALFRALGFRTVGWSLLREALLEHAKQGKLIAESDTPFGRKFVFEGPLEGPDGQKANIRAVWFIESGERAIRFVTAYRARGVRT